MSTIPIKAKWSTADIPNLKGKVALVTGSGAIGGLGFETALALAKSGAKVYVGGRNEEKGAVAVEAIKAQAPSAEVAFVKIDHANLKSVEQFAKSYNEKGEGLDILINNAGVMAIPSRETTSDGFELQFGTNHLSHFALTAHLLPSLRRSPAPRVINVSSIVARQGRMHFDDLNLSKNYSPWGAYNQSKLSNLLFTFELQRRSDANDWGLTALAAHPGLSSTELVKNGPGDASWTGMVINNVFQPLFSQSAGRGALPQLYAATTPVVKPGGYYGPNGLREMKGDVGYASVPCGARNIESARKLWEQSEKMTGVKWE